MIKETKRRMEFFSLYDHTNIEKHLEKMALKGWIIEEIGSYFWKYQKTEPQKLRFSVVYYPKNVNEGTVVSADRQHFIDMCTSDGWKYVINKDQMHIFCTKDENTPPIETDPEIQIECIHKFAKNDIVYGYLTFILFGLLLLLIFGYQIWKEPIESLSDLLYYVWYSPLVIGFAIYNIISYLIWHKKAKHAAETGEFTDTKRLIRFEVLIWLPIHFFSCYVHLLIQYRTDYLLFNIGLTVFAVILFCLFKMIRSAVYKTEHKDKTKRRIRNLIAALLVIVYAASGILVYTAIPKPYEKIKVQTDEGLKTYDVYHDEGAPLDISEFTNVEGKIVDREKSVEEYLLIKNTNWKITPIDDVDWSINYLIIDVRFTPILERCKNDVINNHPVCNFNKIDINTEYEVYCHVTQKTNKRESFVFCDDQRIVEIHFGWEPSKEELLLAAEKLMNADI